MPGFILKDAKFCLLTYSQCAGLNAEALWTHLTTEFKAKIAIFQENHRDGGLHFHAFVGFDGKHSTRNARLFDFAGYHPNIAKVGRTPRKAYDYCAKDKNLVAGEEFEEEDFGRHNEPKVSAWAEIVDAESKDEFWERVKRLDPRALVTNYRNICAYADATYKPVATEHVTRSEWLDGYDDLDVVLRDWAESELAEGKGKESLPAQTQAD